PLAAHLRAHRHPRRHELVQGLLDRVRAPGGHREPGRFRDRHRADREGPQDAPSGGRDPDDLAGPAGRGVQLQGRPVDPEVPQVVPLRLRAADDRSAVPGPAIRPQPSQEDRGRLRLMEKVLISGSAGFIGGYVVEELLRRGYAVVGVDNFSKYGKVKKSYDEHPNYQLVEGDCQDVALMTSLLE